MNQHTSTSIHQVLEYKYIHNLVSKSDENDPRWEQKQWSTTFRWHWWIHLYTNTHSDYWQRPCWKKVQVADLNCFHSAYHSCVLFSSVFWYMYKDSNYLKGIILGVKIVLHCLDFKLASFQIIWMLILSIHLRHTSYR